METNTRITIIIILILSISISAAVVLYFVLIPNATPSPPSPSTAPPPPSSSVASPPPPPPSSSTDSNYNNVIMKHDKSGRCVHTRDGTARDKQHLIFHDGCENENRLRLVWNSDGTISSATDPTLCLHPVDPRSGNNTRVHWWKSCNPVDYDYIKWKITPKGAIQHENSGKCIHPYRGTALNNTELVLHDGCDEHTFTKLFPKA
jgi:hypothetical protein